MAESKAQKISRIRMREGSRSVPFLRNEPGGKLGKPWTWRLGEDFGERDFCETNPAVSWANLGIGNLRWFPERAISAKRTRR